MLRGDEAPNDDAPEAPIAATPPALPTATAPPLGCTGELFSEAPATRRTAAALLAAASLVPPPPSAGSHRDLGLPDPGACRDVGAWFMGVN